MAAISKCAVVPFNEILFPLTEVCFECPDGLSLQSKPAHVIVFEKEGSFPGIKFSLKCQHCKTHYGFSMYGNINDGYKYYEESWSYIEASNASTRPVPCSLQLGLFTSSYY